jgi:hypothetical protein
VNQQRIIEQLDTMVAAGRILEEEAVRLCACRGTDEFDAVLAGEHSRELRARIKGQSAPH